ncbi:MAG: hypothetical protein HC815_31495 [Richelia sp. RM1_1_1]|nr:hypothetical protein [Richelia sp. RM1_1_1]
MFKKSDKFPHSLPPSLPLSSWVRVPYSSFLITSTVFVVFVLDMAHPGYGSFAVITNVRPYIATLTTDIGSAKEKLTHSESLPSSTQETQQPLGHENCRTLLDAYNKNVTCHFNLKNYSNISQ